LRPILKTRLFICKHIAGTTKENDTTR
jgi:hypothetical protein